MAKFHYVGTDRSGRRKEGHIEAASESEAHSKASALGIKITRFEGSGGGALKDWQIITKDDKGEIQINLVPPRVAFKEIVLFTRQLAVLVNAGVSVLQSIKMLEEQTTNWYFAKILGDIQKRIESGEELATAMERAPHVFDSLYSSLVRTGSASGALDKMLEKLSSYLEKSSKLRSQLFAALSYPVGIVVVAVVLVFFQLLFVVPMFEEFFADSGKELPQFTQMVIGASKLVVENVGSFLLGLVGGGLLFQRWSKTLEGRRIIDRYTLHIPIFGILIQKIALARFATTMSTLITGGVALIDALGTCGRASGNMHVEEQVEKLKRDVSNGQSLADSMEKVPVFPKMMSGMVRVGETTGQLDSMFQKVSLFYEDEVDTAIAQVLKMIEPFLFILLGGLVGIVLIAMYLPIFDLASTQL